MVTCITGMHRSGTSMVARALDLAGLYLGEEADLLAANRYNQDGYWEHTTFVDLNDELLHELGGGWDSPVDVPAESASAPRLTELSERARRVIASFAGKEPWGWKDPRSSLTLPFWQSLLPDLTVVLCVRNPLAVAESLRRRGVTSPSLALHLWETYNRRVLADADPARLIVTQYDEFIASPDQELWRVAKFVGLTPSEESIDTLTRTIHLRDRRTDFTEAHLARVGVAPAIRDLYRQLCERAEVSGAHSVELHDGTGDAGDERKIDWAAFQGLRREVATDITTQKADGPVPLAHHDGIRRLNWGCGGRGEPGWINSDISEHETIEITADIRDGLPIDDESLDYIVSIHALPMIPYQDLVPVLQELRRMLKPGGILRLGLPDLNKGIAAYQRGDRSYFLVPDADTESVDGKFIVQMLWYGYSVMLFTPTFAEELLRAAGYRNIEQCRYRETRTALEGITELDDREQESFFVEAEK